MNPTPHGYAYDLHNKKERYFDDLTIPIVRQAQCELRDAFVRAASKLISQYPDYMSSEIIVKNLARHPGLVNLYNDYDVDPRAYVRASYFLKSSAGLAFNLDVTEKNNGSIAPALSPTLGPHVVTLSIDALKTDRTRFAQRQITAINTQIADLRQLSCLGDEAIERITRSEAYGIVLRPAKQLGYNWDFPMTGKIDLAKSVAAFVTFTLLDLTDKELNENAEKALGEAVASGIPDLPESKDFHTSIRNLRARKEDVAEIQNRSFAYLSRYGIDLARRAAKCEISGDCLLLRQCYTKFLELASEKYISRISGKVNSGLTDTLTFTTEIAGGLKPSIEFAATGELKLKTLAVGADATRTDEHKLTLDYLLPENPEPATKPIKLASQGAYQLLVAVPSTAPKTDERIAQCGFLAAELSAGPSSRETRTKRIGAQQQVAPPSAKVGNLFAVPELEEPVAKERSRAIRQNIDRSQLLQRLESLDRKLDEQ
jgi:hypothetical protein